MNILDENISSIEKSKLIKQGLKLQQIGVDLEMKGIQDADIIRFLHSLKEITFFTWDNDFYKPAWVHHNYCLVYLECQKNEIANLIIKFLKMNNFKTKAQRMGKVIKLSPSVIRYWDINANQEFVIHWN